MTIEAKLIFERFAEKWPRERGWKAHVTG